MVLIILVFLLVLGIAFFQAIQGFFSSLIMAILTVLCAAAAFQFYEPLAQLLYGRQPAQADAICLIALFVIPLLLLRLGIDRLIPGNVVLGAWPDRIAGGFTGLITGLVISGVLTLAIQLLPNAASWLLYRPYDNTLRRSQSLAPFYPDEFTLGLVDMLSAGSLQADGNSRFSYRHDNLILETWAAHNRILQRRQVDNEWKTERIGRVDAAPDSLSLLGCYEPNDPPWRVRIPADPLVAEGEPTKLLVVRVGVSESARDPGVMGNWWRLPATQFRLTVRRSGAPDLARFSHYPLAYLTANESNKDYGQTVGHAGVGEWEPILPPLERAEGADRAERQFGKLAVLRRWDGEKGPRQLTVDWVFRIRRDEEPVTLYFRRTAKVDITSIHKDKMPDPSTSLDRIVYTY